MIDLPKSLDLYGVKVPAGEYNSLKAIATILVGLSPASLPLRVARRMAVRQAQGVCETYRRLAYDPRLPNTAKKVSR